MKVKLIVLLFIFYGLTFFVINPAMAQFERLPNQQPVLKKQAATSVPLYYLDDAGMDSFITDIMDKYHIAGGAYCVLKEGEIVWQRNKGYANIEENRLVTDSTLFTLASISKTITATALMQLWEDSLFKLDDNINDHLPDSLKIRHAYYPDDSITFKMLLTHTSGLRDDWNVLESLQCTGDSPISLDTFLMHYLTQGGDYYSKSNFYNSKPGYEYKYCNVGFALIGYLVECISGITFDKYCKEYIFTPLKMHNTFWFLSEINNEYLALPYKWNENSYSSFGHIGLPIYPAGFLRTSAIQLAKFLSMYMNNIGTILDSATISLMVRDHLGLPPSGEGTYYVYRGQGLCFEELMMADNWLWGHTGVWYGIATAMCYNKENNFGIIDMINTGYFDNSWDGLAIIEHNLAHFASLWGKIYAFETQLNKSFVYENEDSLWITTQFVNREQHTFNAQLIYTSTDSTIIDSIPLFDDGAHQDHQASDGIFGCKVGPVTEENEFIVSVSTKDQQNGNYFKSKEMSRFTSIGPVALADTAYNNASYNERYRTQYLYINLLNHSNQKTATDLYVKLSTEDLRVGEVANLVWVPDIEAGTQKTSARTAFKFAEGYHPDSTFGNPVTFNVTIFSNGYPYWTDSFEFEVDSVTSIESEPITHLPAKFELYQNYPNPFNSKTVIRYALPVNCEVDLSIYNLLGQKVATLVSMRKPAGNQRVQWDASGFSSGIYFYTLHTDRGFTQTRKLILLK